ncbi:hypothetical protein IQ265_23970 [Nodosilinea sp. LEGE 06152]|uniref:hypothetical protein n=1 Tax=Nodosilinea sp. LEGE 06152 TaxID=2777966 RepID=UPI0018807003|nr:hypothetical protein [Nodosilinea sp. LEGE 06152]MBE9159867.1 hypothetical protein [Nodosilinea sp. LEGE 06152]
MLSTKLKLKTIAEVKEAIAYVDENLFNCWQAATYRESLLAVLLGRWFLGRLAKIKEISLTGEFQDSRGYFREACAIWMDRLSEA